VGVELTEKFVFSNHIKQIELSKQSSLLCTTDLEIAWSIRWLFDVIRFTTVRRMLYCSPVSMVGLHGWSGARGS